MSIWRGLLSALCRNTPAFTATEPRTARHDATSTQGMEPLEQQFHAGRRKMIAAFVELSTHAARAGVDEDAITELHGEFFDGNVDTKHAYTATAFLAWSRTRDSAETEPPSSSGP